jgi:hypothetical protein
MNQQDRKEFEIVHIKIDEMKKDISELRKAMDDSHKKTDENLRFIKENLFNPHEGLWAETKLNTGFRESTSKWRTAVGIGVIGLFVERMWKMFIG